VSGPPEKLKYEANLVWDGESGAEVCIGQRHRLRLDMPVEYGGKGRFPCPDELFFSAAGGCLVTTYLYFMRKLRLRLRGLQVSVKGTVGSAGPSGYRIRGIEAAIHVEVDGEERSKAEECAELTRRYCHITRSLEPAFPVEVSIDVRTTSETTKGT